METWPKYPEHAINALKKEQDRLEYSISHIWGALYPSKERDEIMLHILNAKRLIGKVITENEEETQK